MRRQPPRPTLFPYTTLFRSALTAVGRAMHVLAAGIHRVVIVRRQRERERPVEAILHRGRGRADRHFGPDLDLARLPGPLVEPFDGAAQAAETGTGRPDDVVVDRVGNRPPAFATRDRMPRAARNRTGLGVLGLLADAAVARPARRRSVLPVSVDVV